MTEHDRERLESLAALVGSGSATPQEQRELDAFVDAHPEAAAQAKLFADAGALLSDDLANVAPPANALARIRTAVAEATAADDSPQHAGAQIISMAERRKKVYLATTMVAAAAAIAFALLWNGERSQRVVAQDALAQSVHKHRTAMVAARNELARAEAQLEAMRKRMGIPDSPDLRLVGLAMTDHAGHAKILIDPNGERWLVVAHALPDIPSDKDFQMWIIPKGQGVAPVPVGLLKPGPTGLLEVEVEIPAGMDPAMAAISLEKKGGVLAPTDVKMIGPI